MEERDLSEFLLELYKKHNLSRFPIAITGYDCIQRGITISSENFMLTHGIMPCSINNSDSGRAFVSQIAGRMKGNQEEQSNSVEDMFQCAMQTDSEWGYEQIADVQERYMGTFQEEVSELKR